MLQDKEATRRMDKAKKYLRLFLRDTPELNRLIRKQESDDELLEFAIITAIDDWNISTPIYGAPVNIKNFPSLYFLLHGATVMVLKSQGLHQARNELSYNTGGSSFVRSNKSQIYQAWMVNFSNEYETKKRNFKIHRNIKRGWGGVQSEYDLIGYIW